MMNKKFDGEFSVYDVEGLDVITLSSVQNGTVEVFVRYRDYGHISFVHGTDYEEFELLEDALNYVKINFTSIMKMYFDEVERIETLYEP